MKAHPFMAAAPTVDKKTAQTSDYFQVPAICILAAYNFYTGLPSPPEQNPEDGWYSAKFPNPAFGASIWNGPSSQNPCFSMSSRACTDPAFTSKSNS